MPKQGSVVVVVVGSVTVGEGAVVRIGRHWRIVPELIRRHAGDYADNGRVSVVCRIQYVCPVSSLPSALPVSSIVSAVLCTNVSRVFWFVSCRVVSCPTLPTLLFLTVTPLLCSTTLL